MPAFFRHVLHEQTDAWGLAWVLRMMNPPGTSNQLWLSQAVTATKIAHASSPEMAAMWAMPATYARTARLAELTGGDSNYRSQRLSCLHAGTDKETLAAAVCEQTDGPTSEIAGMLRFTSLLEVWIARTFEPEDAK